MTTTFSDLAGKLSYQATPPSGAVAGDMYIDSTDDSLMIYDGSVWRGAVLDATSTSTSSSSTTSSSTSITTSTTTSTTTTSTSTTTS